MRYDIQPLDEEVVILGIARTMSSQPIAAKPEPGREYELLFRAIDSLATGEVIVTDETSCCVWGELCAEAVIRRGGNGIVIDGFHRDTSGLRALHFPVFSRGRHLSDLLYHRTITAINEPVQCGGVRVYAGDLIAGNEDGVVVVPSELISSVVAEAYEKSQRENEVRTALQRGMSATEAYRQFGVM
jgi:regulator of RNase E activity RraA